MKPGEKKAMTLGEKISADRKSRGFSQEELANTSGIALRTIQRMEKGAAFPRGYTLNAIALALGKDVEEYTTAARLDQETQNPVNLPDKDSLFILQLMNLSAFAYLMVPFGNFLAPLLIWRKHKNQMDVVEIGKNIIHFQVLWAVVVYIAIFVVFVGQILVKYYFEVTLGAIPFMVFFICYLTNIPLILRAAVRLKRGKANIYPLGLKRK